MTDHQIDALGRLTAPMPTLVVGSRRVTAAVVKQLELTPFDDIEPIGRFKGGGDGVDIVGCHRGTGALARALVPYIRFGESQPVPDACRAEWEHWVSHYIYRTPGMLHPPGRPNVDVDLTLPQRAYDCSYSVNALGVFTGGGRTLLWGAPTSFSCPRPMSCCSDSICRCNSLSELRGDDCDLDALKEIWLPHAAREHARLVAAEKAFDEAGELPLIIL